MARKRPREKKRGEVELSLADQRLEENNASVGVDFTISRVARRERERERERKKEREKKREGERGDRKKRATLALPHCEGREEEDPEMEATISMRIPFH